MTHVYQFLVQHVVSLASATLVVAGVFAYLSKKVGLWGKAVVDVAMASLFSHVGEITDPAKKKLVGDVVLALVKLAEHELPTAGQGAAKYALVAAAITSMFPVLKPQQDKIKSLIEEGVDSMEKELAAQVALRANPPVVPPTTPAVQP